MLGKFLKTDKITGKRPTTETPHTAYTFEGETEDADAPRMIVEPITGWRTWNLGRSYDRPVLISPTAGTVWPHRRGQYFHALCTHEGKARQSCYCGVNAFSSMDLLSGSGYAKAKVWGQVQLWGEVNTYRLGARGEYAHPLELWIDPTVEDAKAKAATLSEIYGCPVHVAEASLAKTLNLIEVEAASTAGARRLKAVYNLCVALSAFAAAFAAYMILTLESHLHSQGLDGIVGPSSLHVWGDTLGAIFLILPMRIAFAMLGRRMNPAMAARTNRVSRIFVMIGVALLLGSYAERAIRPHYGLKDFSATVDKVTADGKARSFTATRTNAAQWAWTFRGLDGPKPCEYHVSYSHKDRLPVRVCHRGRTITFERVRPAK